MLVRATWFMMIEKAESAEQDKDEEENTQSGANLQLMLCPSQSNQRTCANQVATHASTSG